MQGVWVILLVWCVVQEGGSATSEQNDKGPPSSPSASSDENSLLVDGDLDASSELDPHGVLSSSTSTSTLPPMDLENTTSRSVSVSSSPVENSSSLATSPPPRRSPRILGLTDTSRELESTTLPFCEDSPARTRIPLSLYVEDYADQQRLLGMSEWDREQELERRYSEALRIVSAARRDEEIRSRLTTLQQVIFNRTDVGLSPASTTLPPSLLPSGQRTSSPILPSLSSSLPSPYRRPPLYLGQSSSSGSLSRGSSVLSPSASSEGERILQLKREECVIAAGGGTLGSADRPIDVEEWGNEEDLGRGFFSNLLRSLTPPGVPESSEDIRRRSREEQHLEEEDTPPMRRRRVAGTGEGIEDKVVREGESRSEVELPSRGRLTRPVDSTDSPSLAPSSSLPPSAPEGEEGSPSITVTLLSHNPGVGMVTMRRGDVVTASRLVHSSQPPSPSTEVSASTNPAATTSTILPAGESPEAILLGALASSGVSGSTPRVSENGVRTSSGEEGAPPLLVVAVSSTGEATPSTAVPVASPATMGSEEERPTDTTSRAGAPIEAEERLEVAPILPLSSAARLASGSPAIAPRAFPSFDEVDVNSASSTSTTTPLPQEETVSIAQSGSSAAASRGETNTGGPRGEEGPSTAHLSGKDRRRRVEATPSKGRAYGVHRTTSQLGVAEVGIQEEDGGSPPSSSLVSHPVGPFSHTLPHPERPTSRVEFTSSSSDLVVRRPREGAEVAVAVRLAGDRLQQRISHARSRSRPRGLVLSTRAQRERTDDGSFREVFRTMFRRVISRGLVPLSTTPADDDGGNSAPHSDDERFAARVLRLEDYRSRPPSQGTGGQLVTALGEVTALLGTWEEGAGRRIWSSQPRGITSEWHAMRYVVSQGRTLARVRIGRGSIVQAKFTQILVFLCPVHATQSTTNNSWSLSWLRCGSKEPGRLH